jgi:hypothetical protein
MCQVHAKAGDLLVAAMLAASCFGSFYFLWYQQGRASHVLLYQNGQLVQRWPLRLDSQLSLQGPLGRTVVEVRDGRARIAADPSPRQYCVQQGWLSGAGSTALCLPNHTAITLEGDSGHDTLAY